MSTLQFSCVTAESLEPRRFSIHEAVSSLFSVSVWARSPDPALDLDALLDQPVTFRLEPDQRHLATRTLRGVVVAAEQTEVTRPSPGAPVLSTYLLQIAPSLVRLTQRRSQRVFQHLSIPDVVDRLLTEWNIPRVWQIDRGRYPKLEYKVQYAESDYQLFCRLLEEAGIAFIFPDEHEGTLTLIDHLEGNPHRPGGPLPHVEQPINAASLLVTAVRLGREVRPGSVTVRDHEWRNPAFPLFAGARGEPPEDRYEQVHFDQGAFLAETGHAGGTPVADDKGLARHDSRFGQALAEGGLHAGRVGVRRVSLASNAFDLAPGVVFTMTRHPHPALSDTRGLLVLESTLTGTAADDWNLSVEAVFADAPFRPPRVTPKPVIHGVQSARVVGPVGQEIHTDEFGRVRVQFPWDRDGALDEGSSCWVRVSQGWAGIGYGVLALPRVGQEVLVAFAEGDPDLPFIAGRTYDAVQSVPYRLPEHRTRSTWKSDSSLGSGGFNEIMFEDLAGRELIWQQAQKDRQRLVKNDEFATVGHDRHSLVKHDEVERTDGFHKRWVGKDRNEITQHRKRERVEGDVHLAVAGDRREQIDGGQSLTVASTRHEQVRGRHALRAAGQVHMVAGEDFVGDASDVTVAGPAGFLRIDAGGVTIAGTVVKINVSGVPGRGKGSRPEEPEQASLSTEPHDGYFVVLEEGSDRPVAAQRYRILKPDGGCIEGRTDAEGRTEIVATDGPEVLILEVLMDEPGEILLQADDET